MKTKLVRYAFLIIPFIFIVFGALYLQKDSVTKIYYTNSFIDNLYFLVLFLVIPSILAPITEEIAFRGFLTYRRSQYIASISFISIVVEVFVYIYSQVNALLNLPYTAGNILNIKLGFLPQVVNIIIFGVPGLFVILAAILVMKILPKRLTSKISKIKNKLTLSVLFIISNLIFVISHSLSYNNLFLFLYFFIFGFYLSFIAYYFSLRMSIFTHSLLNLIISWCVPGIYIYISNSYFVTTVCSTFIIILFLSIKKELNKLALES